MSVFFGQQSLILTPNERQALALWERDARQRRARGEKAWETLPACSWREFLQALWEEYWLAGQYTETPPSLMNEWQERFLWMKVLRENDDTLGLLNLPAAAQLAAQAWSLCHSYELTEELNGAFHHWPEDTQVFLRWSRSFENACQSLECLDNARLERELSGKLASGELPTRVLPQALDCRGFADWTPAQLRLLKQLRERGVTVTEEEFPEAETSQWKRVEAVDPGEELRWAARWLRQQWEQNPGQGLRAALVIPDLRQRRAEVQRVLKEILQSPQVTQVQETDHTLFDLSVGLPLAQWPLVTDALELLRLDGKPQEIGQWRTLLFSPFVGGAERERHSRAQLWNTLWQEGLFRVPWQKVERLACHSESIRNFASPDLGDRMKAVSELRQTTENRQLPSLWSELWAEELELLGWPGQRKLNSQEYQALARWKRLLGQMGSLDPILGETDRTQALASLNRMAEETLYQPKSSGAQLEVLGTLEAVGLDFDFVWLAGFSDKVWPSSSSPNPYLPLPLQRKHQVAHSTAERELHFCGLVSQALLNTAKVGVVSSPLHTDNQETRPSPLFEQIDLHSTEKLALPPFPTLADRLFQLRDWELLHDPGPPPLEEDARAFGGTNIFKYQSACPFRAFASLRLGARPRQEISEGLDLGQRGTMLHLALEHLWQEVGSLRQWLEWDESIRDELLFASAEHAVSLMRRRRPDVLRGTMVQLEVQRLKNLLAEWMEVEKGRDSFEVLATEERVDIEFSGLNFQATIDRVDKLESGKIAVIDYKTGLARIQDWLGERPKEPQLPLYSIAHQQKVDSLCFARLRTGDMSFAGLSVSEDDIPGVQASEFGPDGNKSWAERQQEWREVLASLAQEFLSGRAVVEPKDGLKTCRACRLESLCRIDEEKS